MSEKKFYLKTLPPKDAELLGELYTRGYGTYQACIANSFNEAGVRRITAAYSTFQLNMDQGEYEDALVNLTQLEEIDRAQAKQRAVHIRVSHRLLLTHAQCLLDHVKTKEAMERLNAIVAVKFEADVPHTQQDWLALQAAHEALSQFKE